MARVHVGKEWHKGAGGAPSQRVRQVQKNVYVQLLPMNPLKKMFKGQTEPRVGRGHIGRSAGGRMFENIISYMLASEKQVLLCCDAKNELNQRD